MQKWLKKFSVGGVSVVVKHNYNTKGMLIIMGLCGTVRFLFVCAFLLWNKD